MPINHQDHNRLAQACLALEAAYERGFRRIREDVARLIQDAAEGKHIELMPLWEAIERYSAMPTELRQVITYAAIQVDYYRRNAKHIETRRLRQAEQRARRTGAASPPSRQRTTRSTMIASDALAPFQSHTTDLAEADGTAAQLIADLAASPPTAMPQDPRLASAIQHLTSSLPPNGHDYADILDSLMAQGLGDYADTAIAEAEARGLIRQVSSPGEVPRWAAMAPKVHSPDAITEVDLG